MISKPAAADGARRTSAPQRPSCSAARPRCAARTRQCRFTAARASSGTPEINRIYRGAKLFEIGAGTNEVRRVIIARELLGL